MACFACYLFATLPNRILLAPYISEINNCDHLPSSHTSAILGVFTMTKCMEGVRAALPLLLINKCQCTLRNKTRGEAWELGYAIIIMYKVTPVLVV